MYCCCCWLSGGYRFLSHHELRPSVGPVLNPYPHNGVCVCVCIGSRHKAEVSAYAYAYACVVSSLCPVYFSSPATLRLPSTTLAILSQPTHTGRGVSRPVKSRSYRHSGRTDSTHRCCYDSECYQRSQFTEDNAEPSFLPGINSLCQFTVPPPGHLCQPHPCGRGLRQWPANQPHAVWVWGTVNNCA